MTEDRWPPAGAFGLAVAGGWAGKLIWLGQAISGDRSKWTHAFFILDGGQTIEGEPGGAEIRLLERYLKMKDVLITDLPVQKELAGMEAGEWKDQMEADLRRKLVRTARELEGAKYNWFNYPALGLLALGVKWERLRKFVRKAENGMICSQFIDFVYAVNGVHLFNDGREPMDVTPGDLARWVEDNDRFRTGG